MARVARHGLAFTPGQHVTLGLAAAAINREYSIYSAVQEDHLDFLVKIHPGSHSAALLARATPGTPLALAGPYGAFCLPEEQAAHARPYWFFAAGVGVAPFHSIVRSYPDLDYRLIHGVREAADGYDRQAYAPARHLLCTSRRADGDFHGRITAWLRHNRVPTAALAYICGPANMVADCYDALRRQGLSSDQITTEVFF